MNFQSHNSSTNLASGQTLFAIVACVFVVSVDITHSQDNVLLESRKAIQKSIPFIQEKGVAWIEDRDCLSCHHTSFMVWSLSLAEKKGFDVDAEILEESKSWALNWKYLANPKVRETAQRDKTIKNENDTIAQLIVSNVLPSTEKTKRKKYGQLLAEGQHSEGWWNPGGQLPKQKRPKRETKDVSTMWAAIALLHAQSRESIQPEIDKALAWLSGSKEGVSTEWWAARLILYDALGDTEKTKELSNQLLKLQREDGGWGWLHRDESDALGTGIALYALSRAGFSIQDSSVQKAHEFLVSTQLENGSWAVKGTKENGKHDFEETSVFWGTCWAVIGMCETF